MVAGFSSKFFSFAGRFCLKLNQTLPINQGTQQLNFHFRLYFSLHFQLQTIEYLLLRTFLGFKTAVGSLSYFQKDMFFVL